MKHRQLTDEILSKLVARRRYKLAWVLNKLFLADTEGESMTISQASAIAGCRKKYISTLAREDIYVHYFYTRERRGVKIEDIIRRGRPAALIQIPTLEKLEKILNCKDKRRYTIECETVAELKAEVVALPIKYRKGKEGDFSLKQLANLAGMSKPTLIKHLKRTTQKTPNAPEHPLTFAELKAMPETFAEYISSRDKNSGWKHLRVRNVNYAYSLPQATLAIKAAERLEDVIVVTQLASHYKYIGYRTESEVIIERAEDVVSGNIAIEDFKKMYPGLFQEEHREHEHLSKNFRFADEMRHHIEREEEQRILKVASFRKLGGK